MKRLLMALLAGLLLHLMVLPASAQNTPSSRGAVLGAVQAESGQPLAAAAVTLRGQADSAVVSSALTDRAGRFRLSGVPQGRYMLEVTLIGYEPHRYGEVVLSASGAPADVGIVRLRPSAISLQGVEVTGQRSPMIVLTDRTVYSATEIPAAATGTASEVLRAVPELDVDIEGRVTTRGATPRIHIDGRPAPMEGEALTRYLQQLPGDRIERIEVIPNPSARFEAEGSGGIVNIVMKRDVDLGLSGNVALFGDSEGAAGPNARLNYQAGRLTLFGGLSGRLNTDEQTVQIYQENRLATPRTFLQRDGSSTFLNWFGSSDLTAEVKVTPNGTLWAQARQAVNGFRTEGVVTHQHLDSERVVTDRYDRTDDSRRDGGNSSLSIGFREVVQSLRNEWSVELRRNWNGGDGRSESGSFPLDATGDALAVARETVWSLTDEGQDDLSLQADLARPWSDEGRVEVGYRRAIREIDNSRLFERARDGVPAPELLRQGEFLYRETVDAAYLTLDRRVAGLNVQAGVRAEHVGTRATVPLETATFERSYTNFFPNLNVASALGEGRQLRLSYARRLNRPPAFALDPTDRSSDPLSRFVGNPYLAPAYTHTLTADASWTGTRGTLRLSPYYRRSTDNWEQIRTSDESGVTTSSWFNVASRRTAGISASASLSQFGPLSGSLHLNGYQEEREARRDEVDYSGSSVRLSAGMNMTLRASEGRSLGFSSNYNPARDIPQGTVGAMIFTNVSIRQQFLDRRASISISVMDPLGIAKFRVTTLDPTLIESQTSRPSFRRASLSLSYSFGRPPESVRRQATPPDEPPTPAISPTTGPGL